ncbi:hypothetical protein [Modestobacter italicus]|uniref:hypothetical protein n=1 Tax=Modestobacter italicus (strain DSM 44449 / CECT 9708 / BC 501) TaxID=2732864 RepID=UPI001C93CD18|nr:hypothetical protein [Modestobacter italicus]
MLCQSTYALDHIDGRRAAVDERVAAWHALAAATEPTALYRFEPVFFNDLVIVLADWFGHHGTAGLDNDVPDHEVAVKEVRLLAGSLAHGSTMIADRRIRLDPGRSVLGHRVGDEIAVREAGFRALAGAFFAELEARCL